MKTEFGSTEGSCIELGLPPSSWRLPASVAGRLIALLGQKASRDGTAVDKLHKRVTTALAQPEALPELFERRNRGRDGDRACHGFIVIDASTAIQIFLVPGAQAGEVSLFSPRPGDAEPAQNLGKKLGKLSAEWAPNLPFDSA